MIEMTWLLMWLNVSVATLNATLQPLVIYRFFKKIKDHLMLFFALDIMMLRFELGLNTCFL